MNYALIISAISCLVGLSGAAFAVFARWKASVEKGYAAQRDFQHLQRNFDQLNANMLVFLKDQKEGFDSLKDSQESRFNRLEMGQSELRTMVSFMGSNNRKKEE